MSFFKELFQRATSKTPPFFNILAKILGAVVAFCTASVFGESMLPKWVDVEILKSVAFVCSGGIAVCMLPINWNKTDPESVPAVEAPVAVQGVKDLYDLPK